MHWIQREGERKMVEEREEEIEEEWLQIYVSFNHEELLCSKWLRWHPSMLGYRGVKCKF